MDLAIGAKQVFVMMDLMTKAGQSKLVEHCTYPLTGVGCVSRVYTDLAIFDIAGGRVYASELVEGLTLESLQEMTDLALVQKPV